MLFKFVWDKAKWAEFFSRAQNLDTPILAAMRRAAIIFRDKIRAEQMSGRKGSRGLNTDTFNLRDRSWRTKQTKVGYRRYTNQIRTSAQYATYWQLGGPKIPKRLYILEDFEKNFQGIQSKQVEGALKRAANARRR